MRSGFVKLFWQTPSDLNNIPGSYLGFDVATVYRQVHHQMESGTHPLDAWNTVQPTKEGFVAVFGGMTNAQIASWLKDKGVIVGLDREGAGYYALTYNGTVGYNEFYDMMRGTLNDIDHMLTQIKVQTFIELVIVSSRFRPSRYNYVVGRSCPIYYKSVFRLNHTGNSTFNPDILNNGRPSSVKQLRNIPAFRDGTIQWKQSLDSYNNIMIDYEEIPGSASNPGYTVGFSYGVNGFVPISIQGQGIYSSSDMFKAWADISQSFNMNSNLDLTRLNGQELVHNDAITDLNQATKMKQISAFLRSNRNLRLPTDVEYAVVNEVPSVGDVITTNLVNSYKVINVIGNPYSPDGFHVDVESY